MEKANSLLPVRNSMLNRWRMEVMGINFPEKFLKKYFDFGKLVDAMITNPSTVDFDNRILHSNSHYENATYHFSRQDFNLACEMAEAFKSNPYLSRILLYAQKESFYNPNFVFEYKGRQYVCESAGETDLGSKSLSIGLDIKTTAASTLVEFRKSVQKLFYDQQGKWYTDNFGWENFLIVGISKKSRDASGRPSLFFVPLTNNNAFVQSGHERYTHWLYTYLEHHDLLTEYKQAA